MSLDPQYLENGRFDNERNPLAFQVGYASHPHGVPFDPEGRITNSDEVILDLMRTNENLTRAVAVLEDQLNELRGRPVSPRDALIHAGMRPGSEPEVEGDEYALSYTDAAVIDPSLDS